MASNKEFEIESQGNRLFGRLFFPDSFDEGRSYPAVIISHGFGSCMEDVVENVWAFIELGYIAAVFDFCMSGDRCRSTGDSTRMTLLTQKQDLFNVMDYLRTLGFIDSITLTGCSQGGLVSALAAAEREKEVERLVLYFPALCIPDHLRSGRVHTVTFDKEHLPETVMTQCMELGQDFLRVGMALDPYEQICRYKNPVFIVHGLEDGLVPIEYSRRAAKLYPDCTLAEIHGGHGFSPSELEEAQKALREFLLKN